MKKSFIGLLTLIVAMSFTSCVKTYYQVSTTKAVNPGQFASVKDGYVYEDSNVKIMLDMWDENGKSTFVLENKTDKNVYLNWEKSSISLNDTTYALNDLTNYNVQRLSNYLLIPAHKNRKFSSYDIVDSIYRIEGLKEKVRRSESMSFDANKSPLTLGYQITYCFDQQQGEQTINLDFYVAQITNYATKSFYKKEKVNKIVNGKVKKVKNYVYAVSPKNGFFVAYTPIKNDIWLRKWYSAKGKKDYKFEIKQ